MKRLIIETPKDECYTSHCGQRRSEIAYYGAKSKKQGQIHPETVLLIETGKAQLQPLRGCLRPNAGGSVHASSGVILYCEGVTVYKRPVQIRFHQPKEGVA